MSIAATAQRLLLVCALIVISFSGRASDTSTNDELFWIFAVDTNAGPKEYRLPKSEMRPETLDLDGRPLHFVEVYRNREQGPKPLVVFVHGTPGGWFDQMSFLTNEFLRDNFHMIAVDRLGHGRSEGKIVSSLQAQAASFKPLLDRDTTGNGAILVGHSLGGPIIARTAMDYPNQTSGLVFIAATADPNRSRRWYNIAAAIPPVRWLIPRQLARANLEIMPLKRELEAMRPLWQNIHVPTTIIQGGKDKLVNHKHADFIKQALVNAEVNMITFPDADHFIHWRQPQIVIDVLSGFAVQN